MVDAARLLCIPSAQCVGSFDTLGRVTSAEMTDCILRAKFVITTNREITQHFKETGAPSAEDVASASLPVVDEFNCHPSVPTNLFGDPILNKSQFVDVVVVSFRNNCTACLVSRTSILAARPQDQSQDNLVLSFSNTIAEIAHEHVLIMNKWKDAAMNHGEYCARVLFIPNNTSALVSRVLCKMPKRGEDVYFQTIDLNPAPFFTTILAPIVEVEPIVELEPPVVAARVDRHLWRLVIEYVQGSFGKAKALRYYITASAGVGAPRIDGDYVHHAGRTFSRSQVFWTKAKVDKKHATWISEADITRAEGSPYT